MQLIKQVYRIWWRLIKSQSGLRGQRGISGPWTPLDAYSARLGMRRSELVWVNALVRSLVSGGPRGDHGVMAPMGGAPIGAGDMTPTFRGKGDRRTQFGDNSYLTFCSYHAFTLMSTPYLSPHWPKSGGSLAELSPHFQNRGAAPDSSQVKAEYEC